MKSNPVRNISLMVVLVGILLGVGFFLNIYTDYMQLVEIGENFTSVFWINFNVKLITYLIAFFIFFVLIFVNCLIIRNNLISIDASFSYLKKLLPIFLISILVSAILGSVATNLVANKFLPFLTSEWFNLGDPIFNQDIGYYIFQRPFFIAIIDVMLAFGGFLIVFTAGIYFALYARMDFYNVKEILKEKGIIIHTIVSVIIYFLIKSVSYKFMSESVLFNQSKEFVGAKYVDIHVWINYYKIAPVILILVVVLSIIFILNSKFKFALLAVLIYPAMFIVSGIIASTMQTLVVSPNEGAVEAAYINNNIQFTRRAYNLDSIDQKDFNIEYNLNGQKIMNNLDTINNIRIIDFAQTMKIANQVQTIKNYYHFTDGDIVVYDINGKPTAVTIAAREMNKDKLDESAKNYINMKMKYTHGMGVIINPVNRITEQGQPYFVTKDVPPRSVEGAPTITEPRIYFGEQADDYVIVKTQDKELDDIETDGYSYTGNAGISMTFLNRLIYSVRYGDFKMLISDQINGGSKLLLNRNVLSRVKKVAPFLRFDQDPTILIDDAGKLKWVIDAYTTSAWYPYAQYSGDINYIKNSVKVVVDAFDGSVKFYIIDKNDPIIKSYNRIYPSLFEQSPFPEDLGRHIRYPEYLFKIQSEILRKYHITNANDFYQKRGMWAISREKYEGEKQRDVEPYYNMMKLQGEKKEELVLMIPYTLVNKDNMVAWLAVRCGMENYGQLVAYNFTKNENVYGTYQIENKIDVDPIVSQEISLWSTGGSSVVRGNLLVIPVDNNLLYVEPLYISSGKEEGALPEIKRIVVAYGDKVVSKPTLDEAIKALFGVNRPTLPNTEETIEDVIKKALENFDSIKEFSKQNDWENYGKSLKALDESMQILREKSSINNN